MVTVLLLDLQGQEDGPPPGATGLCSPRASSEGLRLKV